MSEVDAGQLEAVAQQWQAEGHHEQRASEKKVEAMNAPAAAPAEPVTPPPDAELVKIAAVAWTVIDRLVTGYAGAPFKLQPDEIKQLAEPSAAVLGKYLPDLLKRFSDTPEGLLVGAVGLVYGTKLAGVLLFPAPAEPEPTQTQAAA